MSFTISEHLSKQRRCWIVLLVIIPCLVSVGVVLLLVASFQPCRFMKCHSKASLCINRSLFKAQCVCDFGTAGNGRTVCDECGIKYQQPHARIIGGADAGEHSWPFAVLIRQHYKTRVSLNTKSYTISTSWICGGTLINHKTILTAAHCIKTENEKFDFESNSVNIVWNEFYPNIESTLEVHVGLYDRRKQTQHQPLKVIEVIRHPSFNERFLLNDIALIKLDDYIQPSRTVDFACLTDSLLDFNQTGTVIGFGDTVPGANQGSMVLQQVNLTIYPNEFCSSVSPSTKKNWETQLCSGDLQGRRDACQGDSGGGLYIQRNISETLRYTVDGIVSYGEQCASPMKPGIYTRVLPYLDWIRQNSDFQTDQDFF